MRKRLSCLRSATAQATCLAFLAASLPGRAANIYWDGGGGADTLWSNVANWDTLADGTGVNPVSAPGASDTAYFNASTFGSGGNGTLNMSFETAGFSIAGMVFNNTGANTIANASGTGPGPSRWGLAVLPSTAAPVD